MRIVVERLSYSYQRQRVFGDLNLHIEAGSSVALLGESGVGKSTLLRLLAGLETPQEGQILSGGRTPLELRGLGEVAILAQEPALFPHLTVMGNLELYCASHRRRFDQASAEAITQAVGLQDSRDRYPHELSVGMRARLAIARVMLLPPKLLLLDEPFAALDPHRRNSISELMHSTKESASTYIWSTHSVIEALQFADMIAVLKRCRPLRCYDPRAVRPIESEVALSEQARALYQNIVADTWSANDE